MGIRREVLFGWRRIVSFTKKTNSSMKKLGAISEVTKSGVASEAEKTPDLVSLMVMVDE